MRLAPTLLCALIVCATPSCARPDPRTADVVVEHVALEDGFAYGVQVWQQAGAGLDWQARPSCRSERVCVRLRLGDLKPPTVGLARVGDDWATVTISTKLRAWEVDTVVAHEFGHVLGLRHAPEGDALMRPDGVGPWCMRATTRADWAVLYASELHELCDSEVELP